MYVTGGIKVRFFPYVVGYMNNQREDKKNETMNDGDIILESDDYALNHMATSSILLGNMKLKYWSPDFVVIERWLIWIDIDGIPLKAWSKESITKVTNKWEP
ncbi:hypothetical protein L2E82_40558 [Cichorium intybus]|uniref:Uncharacterized protein n=1 Tax=Cichorium intybus TaxID=13427 RepID=A0ACB9ALG1_CICIN|nr:hypothetical protein L2E82_40558 [Cichorium intybus]